MNILIPKKNVIFDSQILSTLMGCERLTNFTFNLHLRHKNGKPIAMEKGSLIHEILKVYYRAKIKGSNILDARRLAMLAAEQYIINEMKVTPPDQIQQVLETMGQYFTFYQNEHWTPIEVERVRNEIVYEDDEIRVLWKSKLDLFVDTNNGLYPVDHKSFSRKADTLSLNNQFMGQCFVTKSNGIIIDKIGLYKLDAKVPKRPEEKFLRPMISYTEDRIKEWQQLVGYYAKYWVSLTEIGFYPPRFSHCDKFRGCQFKGVCENNRNMREEELNRFFEIGEPWEPVDDED